MSKIFDPTGALPHDSEIQVASADDTPADTRASLLDLHDQQNEPDQDVKKSGKEVRLTGTMRHSANSFIAKKRFGGTGDDQSDESDEDANKFQGDLTPITRR